MRAADSSDASESPASDGAPSATLLPAVAALNVCASIESCTRTCSLCSEPLGGESRTWLGLRLGLRLGLGLGLGLALTLTLTLTLTLARREQDLLDNLPRPRSALGGRGHVLCEIELCDREHNRSGACGGRMQDPQARGLRVELVVLARV